MSDALQPRVSVVIPARNEAAHLDACLSAVAEVVGRTGPMEVIVVDDGSTDGTADVAERFAVQLIRGSGRGAAAARNLGVAHAAGELIWFLDADCVPRPDALAQLLPHVKDDEVAAVGGSYGNMQPHSLLASLIQEEIAARHQRMGTVVNFLATFNVLYRKRVLLELGGFNEDFLKGQDAELAFRAREAGYTLHFEPLSVVRHFHETSLLRYLEVQRQQGMYRVRLYQEHPKRMGGDSYSNAWDHVQPPLAMASLALLPTLLLGPLALVEWCAMGALGGTQLPMTLELVRRTGDARMLAYLPMGSIRAYARGVGLTEGTLRWVLPQALRRRRVVSP